MRFLIGDFGVESLDSGEVLILIRALPPSATPLHIVTFNSLMYPDALASPDFAAALSSADLLLAESSGIKWAAKFLYNLDITPLAGIDLVTSWFEESSRVTSRFPTTFYFFGGQPGVARDAAAVAAKRFPNVRIAGWRDGFFDEKDSEAIAREIVSSGAEILLAGLGSPRQELWISRNKHLLRGVKAAVGVGGALDVFAGRVRRAPAVFRGIGAEWLWRLIKEPRRAARIARLPFFVAEMVKLKIKYHNK